MTDLVIFSLNKPVILTNLNLYLLVRVDLVKKLSKRSEPNKIKLKSYKVPDQMKRMKKKKKVLRESILKKIMKNIGHNNPMRSGIL